MALLACKGTSDTPAPAATAGVVQPPKPSAAPPEPKRQVLTRFDGEELQECIEVSPPPGKEEAFEKVIAKFVGMTRIGQRCASLGHVALGTCSSGEGMMTYSYYQSDLLKTAMADCLKRGEAWSANTSPEADLAKAEQRLKKLQGGR